MARREKILSHLGIGEDTYNNLVIDSGLIYLDPENPAQFWRTWWEAWDDGDKVELEISDPNQTIRRYAFSQVMACRLLLSTRYDTKQATRSDLQVR